MAAPYVLGGAPVVEEIMGRRLQGPIERYIDGGNQAYKDVFHCSFSMHSSIDIDSPKTENAPYPAGKIARFMDPANLEWDSV